MIQYYVTTNEKNAIVAHSSNLVLPPEEIFRDEWKPIQNAIEGEIMRDGVPLYELRSGKAANRTKAEIAADTYEFVVKPMIEKKKIESEDLLADFLAQNPLKSYAKGGKPALYNVTFGKQGILTGKILIATAATSKGIPYPLTWNATGQPCEPWDLSELEHLSFEIAIYVTPFVTHQQNLEIMFKSCKTLEELAGIAIDYSGVMS